MIGKEEKDIEEKNSKKLKRMPKEQSIKTMATCSCISMNEVADWTQLYKTIPIS